MTVVSEGGYLYRVDPFPEGKTSSGEVVVPLLRSLPHLRFTLGGGGVSSGKMSLKG